ncbi:ABC transporter permease [Mycobacterium sp. 4D054]|uniref:ABC transporter permease n=1 Tax=unclassified Mycobacterium TaxID=2642494 RepID=UPI0021B3B9F7|nr:ABC transporter permease subunit [Mycobacterium sp. SMC-8]UXA12218.1 ABC transporter permease subunit [Mycobacterium sp. SMC-8]
MNKLESKYGLMAVSVSAVLAALIIWQIAGTYGGLFWLLPPSEILSATWSETINGALPAAAAQTLLIALIGVVVGSVLGVAVGALMGYYDAWNAVLDPLVKIGFAAPLVMLVPVISIYFGMGTTAKIAFTVLFCIFIVIINTAAGLREVPDEVMEMARAFEVTPRAMMARILIPWAGPYILTGIRMSVGRSIQGALIADLFLRAEGLGLYMIKAGSSFELDHLYAAVLVLTVLGALVMSMAKAGENRLLAWKTA